MLEVKFFRGVVNVRVGSEARVRVGEAVPCWRELKWDVLRSRLGLGLSSRFAFSIVPVIPFVRRLAVGKGLLGC